MRSDVVTHTYPTAQAKEGRASWMAVKPTFTTTAPTKVLAAVPSKFIRSEAANQLKQTGGLILIRGGGNASRESTAVTRTSFRGR